MGKRGKVKPAAFDAVPEQKLVMRFAEIRRESASTDDRSVEVIIATENPVERYDSERGIVVREILAMDGMEFRGGRNQLPIVDSHDRSTVANVLGSVRNIRIEGDELVGRAFFASDDASQTAFRKLIDGHLTDFSITASPKEIGFVERGKQYTTRRGDVVDGPADIVTRWMPTDASLVATGADERSVVRRSYTDIPRETRRMDENMLSQLASLGMPAEITDPNAAMAWVLGYLTEQKPMQAAAEEPIESMEEEKPVDEVMQMDGEQSPEDKIENAEGETDMAKLEEAVDRALKADRSRQREIRAMCEGAGLDRSYADALCEKGVSLDIARKQVLEKIVERNKAIGQSGDVYGVRITKSSDDKFYEAVRDGLLQRAYTTAGVRRTVQSPAAGSEDFRHIGLRRLAERFVERMGCNIDRMAPRDIAMVALGHPATLGRHNISREAYHTTGSFANLMLDAANKTLLAAYDEAQFTWNVWARQAPSTPDFKNINRIRFSESPDLKVVPENHDYDEGSMSDQKESYKVEKFGRLFTVTWETIVNDDLDAISRIPAMQGNAARRTQNKKVYEVLTANDLMSDGVALFGSHSSGTNLAGSTGAPSVTTLNAGFTAMRTQKGLSSDVIIDVNPRYLIVPAALEATALELVNSTSYIVANGNSGVQNIYGQGGSRSLVVIGEPQLDSNSTTAWYLVADSAAIDTVELCFLQGEESPVLENEWDFDKDCYKYKVRQTFGVKAIDWRGVYKNAG